MRAMHTLAMICRPAGDASGPMPVKILGVVAALYVALAAFPAFAQEGAPPAGGDIPQAGGGPGPGPGDSAMKSGAAAPDAAATTRGDIEPVTPVRGPTGLQRRANLKALIANSSAKPAGPLAGNTRVSPSLTRPGVAAGTARNSIGVAMPEARSPGRDGTGIAAQARVAGVGVASGSVGSATSQMRHMPVPTNAGAALHGAGVNGTTMGRVVSGPASVGGPARVRTGINGTSMRSRL